MTTASSKQKEFRRAHRRGKTYRAIAAEHGVNVFYVYDLAVNGIEPKNPVVRNAFGLHRLKPPKPESYTPAWVVEATNNLQRLLDLKENR